MTWSRLAGRAIDDLLHDSRHGWLCGVQFSSLVFHREVNQQTCSEEHRNQRALTGLSTRRIEDVKEGEIVRIEGRVRALDDVLVAPLTGRRCVHFELRVEKRARKGHATELVRDIKSVAFDVKDETGTAHIEVSSFYATVDLDEETLSDEVLTPGQKGILAAHGQPERSMLGLRQPLVFREGALEDGERVVVVGRVRFEDDPEGAVVASEGYREQRRKQRVVIESHADPVRASDAVSALSFSNVR